jgi:hypothetical protein
MVSRGCLLRCPYTTVGRNESQVQSLESSLRQQYSNSNLKNLNNSNSTVKEVFSNLVDVIPEDDYMPFYISRHRDLGTKRFVELANKARAGGKNPQRLFFWMLKNNELVK